MGNQECWSVGGCRDDGAAVCEWCGEHGGVSMYCCRQDWPYSPGHNCYNAGFGAHGAHRCVTPASVNPPPSPTPRADPTAEPTAGPTPKPTAEPTPAPTIAPSPTDNLHQECWTTGGCRDDGAAVCEWCGEHGGVSMYCCRQDWPYSPGHNCYNAGFGTHKGHHVCVTPASVDPPPTPAPTATTTATATTTTRAPSPTPAPSPAP